MATGILIITEKTLPYSHLEYYEKNEKFEFSHTYLERFYT